MDEEEKKTTAFHESGHAMVGLCVKHGDPVDKVTIIPRGFSLGATHFMPKKNRLGYWKKEVLDQLAIYLGGRAAEEIIIGELTTGASSDIERATDIARKMVCNWGMSTKIGPLVVAQKQTDIFIGRDISTHDNVSEETARLIDAEIHDIIDSARTRALKILEENRVLLEEMSAILLEKETLDASEIFKIVLDFVPVEQKAFIDKKLKQVHEMKIELSDKDFTEVEPEKTEASDETDKTDSPETSDEKAEKPESEAVENKETPEEDKTKDKIENKE